MTKKTKKTKGFVKEKSGLEKHSNKIGELNDFQEGIRRREAQRLTIHDPNFTKIVQKVLYESSKQPKEGLGYLISPPPPPSKWVIEKIEEESKEITKKLSKIYPTQPPSKWVIDGLSDEAKEITKKLAKEHKKKIGEIVNQLILNIDDTVWEVKALRLRNKQLLQEISDLKTPWYKFWR